MAENERAAGYTPGPWAVYKTESLGACGVWTDYPATPNGHPMIICSMLAGDGRMSWEQRDADAQLIAAAPDMQAEIDRLRAERAELLAAIKRIAAMRDEIANGAGALPDAYQCFDDWAADFADAAVEATP